MTWMVLMSMVFGIVGLALVEIIVGVCSAVRRWGSIRGER